MGCGEEVAFEVKNNYMKKDTFDYVYTLEFLKKVNTIKYGDELLCNLFFYDKYNLWQGYQQSIFAKIKVFSKRKKYDTQCGTKLSGIKDIIVQVFILSSGCMAFFVLLVSGRKTIIYSVDKVSPPFRSDFRIEELYRVLKYKNIRYIEFFHTILGRSTLMNMVKRLRPAFYIESFDILFKILVCLRFIKLQEISFIEELDLSQFKTQSEKFFVKKMIKDYIFYSQLSKFRITVFSRLLSFSKVKVLFGIDDARSYQEIIVACRNNNIISYALQHGHFTKYHVGWLDNVLFEGECISPDVLLVWSEYWKKELVRLGTYFTQEQIVVGGMKEVVYKAGTSFHMTEKETIILIPYENDAPKEELKLYISKLLTCPHVKLIFKLRPDMPKKQQLEEYDLTKNEDVLAVFNFEDIISNVDIVAGVYSTFLYDVLRYEKKVALFKTTLDYGEGIVINGLGDCLGPSEEVCKQILIIKNTSKKIIEERKQRLYGITPISLEKTLGSIMSDIV